MTHSSAHGPTVAERVCTAVNAHDLDEVVACFTEDYLNETPAHPARGFRGREQVRRNWRQIFTAVPDVQATLVRSDQVHDRVWSEWEMRGRGRDGRDFLLRGVMLFSVTGDQASAVRFYLEPVEIQGPDADGAVADLVSGSGP